MPVVDYRCTCCGREEEHFHHRRDDAPEEIKCSGAVFAPPERARIERRTKNPDGTETIEYEEIELAPALTICTGAMRQRISLPGEYAPVNARRFEAIVVYENPNVPEHSDKRFYFPARNNEPAPDGFRRVEMTNIAEANSFTNRINRIETEKMREHRAVHEAYWNDRRKSLRDNVNARIRSNPALVEWARRIRARSDQRALKRYGKPLDAHFHMQLIEFNQSNMQDYCDKDTGWKSTRAR